ncbi:MAG: PspA/IM30 family protein, partial [Myxococcales bacterium]|nr:PspA/IM30 family protein [Myxococcales bacterium]
MMMPTAWQGAHGEAREVSRAGAALQHGGSFPYARDRRNRKNPWESSPDSALIKSNINDLITKAEDPEKMLTQVLLEMQQQLAEAKKAVAVAIADEKEEAPEQTRRRESWEPRSGSARRWSPSAAATTASRAPGARAQARASRTSARQFQNQWIAQKQAVEKLKDALRLLNNKIEEAKRKKNILIARKKRAEAQQQIANTMQGLGDTRAFDTFDRMADRIELMEAEAEAGAELAGELSGDTLSRVEVPGPARRGRATSTTRCPSSRPDGHAFEAPKRRQDVKAGDVRQDETPGARDSLGRWAVGRGP